MFVLSLLFTLDCVALAIDNEICIFASAILTGIYLLTKFIRYAK